MTVQLDSNSTAGGQKRRVVGAIVLLALAVIILPIVFDGEGSYQPPVETRIPERPIIDLMPEPQQSRPIMSDTQAVAVDTAQLDEDLEESSSESAAVEQLAEQAEPTPTDAQRVRPTLAASGLPEGWVVQVGSFENSDNAAKLTARLLASGEKAYERRRQRDSGELVTVFVGPVTTRQAAERLLQSLADREGVQGMVKRFELGSLD